MASSRALSHSTLLHHVVSILRAHLPLNSRVCVGLSGGRDSVVMLHLLSRAKTEIPIEVSAIHVNHQISPNAQRWADFCSELCAQLGVPLTIERVDVSRVSGQGLEASARNARYAAYERVDAAAIVLGHHRNDQAETVLLQALRGAGLRGISAMPVVKTLGKNQIILRPLLDVAPRILSDYADENNLAWITDESNDDRNYTRNFLRHEIFPNLEKHIPQSVQSLTRLSAHAAEAQLLLDDLAMLDRAKVVCGERLSLSRLLSLPARRAKNLLRQWFAEKEIPMTNAAQLDEILQQLSARHADDQTEIRWGGIRLCCYCDEIYFMTGERSTNGSWQIGWQNESALVLPGSSGVLRAEKKIGEGIAVNFLAGKKITVRSRAGGEQLALSASRPRRSLKNLLQEARIPPWRREIMPLLFCDETLIFAPEIGVDFNSAARDREPGWLFVWYTSGGEA